MEQYYSHHHMRQVHHSGLVIGTLIGSCAVTVFVALAVVATNPNLLLHPLSINSSLSSAQNKENSTSVQPAAGAAAQSVEAVLPIGVSGSGAQATSAYTQQ